MERTEIDLCKDSGSQKSRQDEKKKSWSCSHKLGQSDVEMGGHSKMVGDMQRLGKLCENS